ncbi:MAG: ABC transporter ATP-binding protein [Candidatus Competibacteraceae bacterium]
MSEAGVIPPPEQVSHHGLLYGYSTALAGYAPLRLGLALGLLLLVSITEGIGLLLLVPLLQLVGSNQENTITGGATDMVRQAFVWFDLRLTLPVVLCLYVGLVSGRAILVRWRTILLMEIRLGFVDHLRNRLYSAICRANWLFLVSRRNSDFTHVLTSDINRIGEGTYFFLELIVAGLMAAVHILVAFNLSAVMAGLALATGACLLLLLWPQVLRSRALGARLTEAERQVFGTVSQFLDGIKLAKSYGVEARHYRAFTEAIAGLRLQLLAFTRSDATARLIFQVGAAFALSGLLYLATTVLQLPAAELLVLILIFARLLPLLSQLQQDYQYFVHMLPAFAVFMRLEARCCAAAEPVTSQAEKPLLLNQEIRLQNVHFRYDKQDGSDILAGVDLCIPARQTTALVGPSGAGKSTLADLLMGLLLPDTGRILVDGEPLPANRIPAWRRVVSYVPQESFLLHDTVRANLLWSRPDAADEALWEVLQLAAADEFVTRLPQGLDTIVGERGIRLSGGERQRIALARALLRQPSLLLLDEATSALDTEHERRIQQAIEQLHGKLTIVLIAHRLSTVRHADLIAVMDAGKVAETGNWESLSRLQAGRFQALLRAATERIEV